MSRKERQYQEFIRLLPCLVCYDAFYAWLTAQPKESQDCLLDMIQLLQNIEVGTISDFGNGKQRHIQTTPTECAHLGLSTSRRGLSQKYPAMECGPLCRSHHQEAGDSHHAGTATFWSKHPMLDRDGLLQMLQRIFESKPVEVSA
jgi:hypothetical protein